MRKARTYVGTVTALLVLLGGCATSVPPGPPVDVGGTWNGEICPAYRNCPGLTLFLT